MFRAPIFQPIFLTLSAGVATVLAVTDLNALIAYLRQIASQQDR